MNALSFGLKLLPALAFVALTGAAMASPNLVTNGSFESTSLSGKGKFLGNVTGWTGGSALTYLDFPGTAANGTSISVYGPFPATSPDGGNFVEADGSPNYSSTFSQTINGLTIGNSYTLTFDQAAGQQAGFTGPTTEQWSVSFGGVTQLSDKYSLAQGGVGAWETETMTFTATAVSQALSFLAVGTPTGEPPISFLDGVSLTATTTVPEPASWLLLGAGLVGLTAFRMRRRASRATNV